MIGINNLRGMLLEEAILFLLRYSGFETVERPDGLTLINSSIGIKVRGRGGDHQIDAIADLKNSPPFINKIRLFVEGKCYKVKSKVGLQVVRNTVGLLKDLNEFFVPPTKKVKILRKRNHYAYSIFSASEFSWDAIKYAYAHDIYLLCLGKSFYFKSIIDSIYEISEESIRESKIKISLKMLRSEVRNALVNTDDFLILLHDDVFFKNKLIKFIHECRKVNLGFIVIAGESIPIFIVPQPGRGENNLSFKYIAGIYYENGSWYFTNSNKERIFSFDFPEELLMLSLAESNFNFQNFKLKVYLEQDNEIRIRSLNIENIDLLREKFSKERVMEFLYENEVDFNSEEDWEQ